MAKIIKIDNLETYFDPTDPNTAQLTISDPDKPTKMLSAWLDKEDTAELIKELQRIHAKMTQ